MYTGPCIIVIVEEQGTNLMSLVIMFYLTSSMLNIYHHIGRVFFTEHTTNVVIQ